MIVSDKSKAALRGGFCSFIRIVPNKNMIFLLH